MINARSKMIRAVLIILCVIILVIIIGLILRGVNSSRPSRQKRDKYSQKKELELLIKEGMFCDVRFDLIKLLGVKIIADEDSNFFVSFAKYHPELKRLEFVRLILHYYAKILYVFDPSDLEMSTSAIILKNAMDLVLSENINKESNILELAEFDDVVTIVTKPPPNIPREIEATLFFVNTFQRHITTPFSVNTYVQQLVFSVMVLIQTALKKMDQLCIETLNLSLRNMNAAYNSGVSYSDMTSLIKIPTDAYLSAIVGEQYRP